MRDLGPWEDPSREDVLRVVQVDPHSLDTTYGDLSGVEPSSVSVTEGYYTDARVSAKLTALSGGYRDYCWLRLVHECPGTAFREELGTFVVAGRTDTRDETEMDLRSVLWAISDDTQAGHLTIGQGALSHDVFRRICQAVGKEGEILAGAGNHRYASTVVYETGDSYLSDLFDLCDAASCRLGVDGHGRITMGPYVAPSLREPDWLIDPYSSRSMVLEDGLSTEDTTGQAASRSVVTYKGSDAELSAAADVPSSSPASASRRGYTIAEVHSVSELMPATQAQAQAMADSYVAADSASGRTRSAKCLYFPVHAGDVVAWREADGTVGRWLVKEADTDCGDWTVSLSLKEV